MKKPDHTGKVFGAYLLLAQTDKGYMCRCQSCGHERNVSILTLRTVKSRGITRCAKCPQIHERPEIDRTGEIHGPYIVIRPGSTSKHWMAQCTCGTVREMTRSQLYWATYNGSTNCPACRGNSALVAAARIGAGMRSARAAGMEYQRPTVVKVERSERTVDLGGGWFRGMSYQPDPAGVLQQHFINGHFRPKQKAHEHRNHRNP